MICIEKSETEPLLPDRIAHTDPIASDRHRNIRQSSNYCV